VYEECFKLYLDNYVEYKNGCEQHVYVRFWDTTPCGTTIRGYVEIDIESAKCGSVNEIFSSVVAKGVPTEVVQERNREEMIRNSSANPTVLAITREGMDRVDRGEEADFKFEIEDNGIKYSLMYKKW
jgi:hypothetical protein